MFGLGMEELLVILVIVLILFGPKKLPDLATGLGKAARHFREATRERPEQLPHADQAGREPLIADYSETPIQK